MNSSFTDCCVRYGQECVYTKFSQGNMTLGEIYMTLIYGLIDPACLPSMAVIYHDNKVWCTDTRRLTLAKELERQGKWDVLELMRIHQVERNTAQYRDFVNHRLPAMRRRGFNGLTVQVSDNRGPTCCFNSDSRLRADLEDHIINDHLNYMTLKQFKDLAHFYCDMCHKTTQITCKKSTKASYYTIIRKCGCQPKNTHRFSQPWTNITLQELCDELKRYKQCTEQPKTSTLRGHPSQKPSNTNTAKDQLINNISRTNGSTSTSTPTVKKIDSFTNKIDSQKSQNDRRTNTDSSKRVTSIVIPSSCTFPVGTQFRHLPEVVVLSPKINETNDLLTNELNRTRFDENQRQSLKISVIVIEPNQSKPISHANGRKGRKKSACIIN